jgi:hypothetical protein
LKVFLNLNLDQPNIFYDETLDEKKKIIQEWESFLKISSKQKECFNDPLFPSLKIDKKRMKSIELEIFNYTTTKVQNNDLNQNQYKTTEYKPSSTSSSGGNNCLNSNQKQNSATNQTSIKNRKTSESHKSNKSNRTSNTNSNNHVQNNFLSCHFHSPKNLDEDSDCDIKDFIKNLDSEPVGLQLNYNMKRSHNILNVGKHQSKDDKPIKPVYLKTSSKKEVPHTKEIKIQESKDDSKTNKSF